MPIARRDVLLLARMPAFFRSRIYTGLICLLAGTGFAFVYARSGAGPGPFIGIVGYMLTLMCMFTGAQITADAVAKEKREGTLGLLFLTGLGAWQIAAGKLVAHSLFAFTRVFVLFPLLTLLMIVGGVAPGAVLATGLALINTLFATACVGIFISTGCTDQKHAAGRATVAVLFLWWGLPALAMANSRFGGPNWLSSALMLFSLNSSFIPAGPGMRLGTSGSPWINLISTHVLGWLFLLLAVWRIQHAWQDAPERRRFSFKQVALRVSRGGATFRRRLREKCLDSNPFLWLALRDRFRAAGLWFVTGLMIALGAWIYFASSGALGPLIGLCIATTIIHRFIVCGTAAAQLMIEQEQGTLEMLLSTPLTAREVIQGQFQAAVRQIRGPVLVVLCLHAWTWWMALNQSPGDAVTVTLGLGLSVMSYLFDVYTALWLAMWGASISSDSKRASGAAIARLFGAPFLVVASYTTVTGLLTFFAPSFRYSPSQAVIIGALITLSAGNNLFWILRTRRKLPALLQTFAFRRYATEEPTGFFGHLGRQLGRFYRINLARVR